MTKTTLIPTAPAREGVDRMTSFGPLVGRSPAILEVYETLRQVGPSSASVLITGESGTGKELVARTLHDLSPRRKGPFVAINCAAIPETLLESEIFGHEKGAFTGATQLRPGCFELASGGTLFLDELEMAPTTQAKLLRVLEDKGVRRLGSREEVPVDVRVIAATNRDVRARLAEGNLREDLYYRLNVFTLVIPPLRARIEDISLLVEHFVAVFNEANGKSVLGIDDEALDRLERYHWPGNVRELRNVVHRAVILASGPRITARELPARLVAPDEARREAESPPHDAGEVILRVGTSLEDAKRSLILKTLEVTRNNKTRAADLLGISAKTLYNKLAEWGIPYSGEAHPGPASGTAYGGPSAVIA